MPLYPPKPMKSTSATNSFVYFFIYTVAVILIGVIIGWNIKNVKVEGCSIEQEQTANVLFYKKKAGVWLQDSDESWTCFKSEDYEQELRERIKK